MSKVLGKRKTRDTEERSAADLLDAQEIFRRHFEAQFKPLAVAPIRPPPTVEVEDDEDPDSEAEDSEWEGISEDEEGTLRAESFKTSRLQGSNETTDDGVEVVDHATSQKPIASMSKSELKKFMVRPPPAPSSPLPSNTANHLALSVLPHPDVRHNPHL